MTSPPNRKPSQCNMMIPYFKLTLRGQRKIPESQAETPINQPKNEEEIEPAQSQPDNQGSREDSKSKKPNRKPNQEKLVNDLETGIANNTKEKD